MPASLEIDLSSCGAPEAIAEAQARLAAGSSTVALRAFTGSWELEEELNRPSALQRLRQLAALGGNPSQVPPYRAFDVDPSAPAGTRLPQAVRLWINCNKIYSGSFVRGLNDLDLWTRAVVLAWEADQGALCYKFIGREIADRIGPEWAEQSLGRSHRYDGQFDAGYSGWASAMYDRAFAGRQVLRHYVDAVMNYAAAELPRRVNYDRILLPMMLVTGKPALVSISETRAGLVPLTRSAL